MLCEPPAELPGYEVEALVGHGSVGSVYKARRREGGALAAVKWVPDADDPRVVLRIRREAEALNALDHRHIVRILDVVETHRGLALVTQWAEGGSLAEVIAVEGRLEWRRASTLAMGVADALDAAHRAGVLHCDLKPSNILLASDGSALVSDFGVARWTAGTAGAGTAEYLDAAVAGGAPPEARSDVYSLGVVCHQILTGELPFIGPSPSAVLRAARRARPVPIRERAPDVIDEVAGIVERAMDRKPGNRPASAGELARSLRVATARALPAAPSRSRFPPTAPSDPSASVPSSRRGWAGAGVVLAGAVMAASLAPMVVCAKASRTRPPPASPARAGPARAGCGPGATLPLRPNATVLAGDVGGDGCRVAVSWADNVVEAGTDGPGALVRYRLGDPGDVLLLGDWDCRGSDVPALYRPATGEVFLFPRWAGRGERLAAEATVRTGVVLGRARVVRIPGDGCDQVVVDRPVVGKHMRPRQSG